MELKTFYYLCSKHTLLAGVHVPREIFKENSATPVCLWCAVRAVLINRYSVCTFCKNFDKPPLSFAQRELHVGGECCLLLITLSRVTCSVLLLCLDLEYCYFPCMHAIAVPVHVQCTLYTIYVHVHLFVRCFSVRDDLKL